MTKWKDIDRDNLWHPFTPMEGSDPIYIKEASGSYLYQRDGKPLLDLISSWWVNIHGHANPKIAKAISKQSRKLEQVIFAGFTHKPALRLSRNLLEILPPDQDKIFFSDDGSTSTEVALKMAIQYWHNQGKPRTKIIAIEGAYHGDTFGAMSIGDRGIFNLPFHDLLFDVEFIPFPEGDGENAKSKMKELVGDDIAAFIYEPLVQGSAGMRMYSPDILSDLLEIAKQHEIVCIADEVMTGFGRTGKIFASDHIELKPDIFCLSKGLTGGFLPMGITTANKRIVSAFATPDKSKTFYHGHSYTANPIACAAANASYKILRSNKTRKRIDRICEIQQDGQKRFEELKVVREARATGTILRIEIGVDDTGYTSSIRDRIYQYFLSNNLLLRPLGNVIYLIPPYVINEDDLRRAHDVIETFLKEELG